MDPPNSQAWREKLYGDVYRTSAAWAGYRVAELSDLFEYAKAEALRPADSRAGVQEAQRWMRLAVSTADAIRSEMARIEPEVPKLTAHVSLTSKEAPELAAELGAKIAEYARAGLLDEFVEMLMAGAPDAGSEPIEATAVGARR